MSSVPLPTSAEIPADALPLTCQTALQLLLQAREYAADLSLNAWDFALEINNLRHAGVGHSDLRWLVCKAYVEHAQEYSGSGDQARQFQHGGQLVLSERSCFVLTPAGLSLAQTLCAQPRPAPVRESAEAGKPKYHVALKELTFDGELVKRFRVPAPTQELILSAFEEEGWPPHLDDPLPPEPEVDPKKRLHDSISRLNRNQKRRVIRFLGAGDGRGLRWERMR